MRRGLMPLSSGHCCYADPQLLTQKSSIRPSYVNSLNELKGFIRGKRGQIRPFIQLQVAAMNNEEKGFWKGLACGVGVAVAFALSIAPKPTVIVIVCFLVLAGIGWVFWWLGEKYNSADDRRRARYNKIWKVVGYITSYGLMAFLLWSFLKTGHL